MKKVLFLILIFQSVSVVAQTPEIIWKKTFGTKKNEAIHKVVPAKDGKHLLLFGYRQAEGRYDIDILAMKVDTEGEVVWEKTFGQQSDDIAHDAIEQANGNWLILGERTNKENNSDVWLLNLTTDGQLEWDQHIGGIHKEAPRSFLINKENQIVITGRKEAAASRIAYAFVMKTDLEGKEISTEIYGSDNMELVQTTNLANEQGEATNKIIQTKDGGYLLVGHTMTLAKKGLATDGWICKIDSNGKKLWSKALGAIGGDDLLDAHEDSLGNIYLTGERYSKPKPFKVSFWLLKFSPDGEILIDEHFNKGNLCTGGRSVFHNKQSILLAGASNNTRNAFIKPDTITEAKRLQLISEGWTEMWSGGKKYLVNDYSKTGHKDINENVWLVQTDLKGNKLWDKEIKTEGDEKAMTICKSKSGVIFIAGYTYAESKGGKDIVLIKLK